MKVYKCSEGVANGSEFKFSSQQLCDSGNGDVKEGIYKNNNDNFAIVVGKSKRVVLFLSPGGVLEPLVILCQWKYLSAAMLKMEVKE